MAEPMRDILDEIDEECRKHGLPPLSWLVSGIPGRKDATPEQIAQVHAVADQYKNLAAWVKLKSMH